MTHAVSAHTPESHPEHDPAKSPQPWLRTDVALGSLVLVLVLGWTYWGTLRMLARVWMTQPDYSHGFLVPMFSAYLLWHRRDMLASWRGRGSWWGLAVLLVAAITRWAAAYFFFPLLGGTSLIICLAGVVLLLGGWRALAWAWPALAFLVFMVPLPAVVANLLSLPLQRVATLSSTWLLQMFGVPAVARGNVIFLTENKIGVVEACSGLRMLMLFLALTVGASFLIQRPLWEKVFVAISALVIGLITNIIRITATAVLYEYAGKELGDMVFHDLAGWLMMPVATALLFFELYLLSKLLIEDEGPAVPIIIHR